MSRGEEHKELIQQMAERLRNHVEPYRAGAWERFSAAYGHKQRKQMWPYWSAAAILLAAIGIYFVAQQPSESSKQPQLVQQERTPQSLTPLELGQTEADSIGTVRDQPNLSKHDFDEAPLRDQGGEHHLLAGVQSSVDQVIIGEAVSVIESSDGNQPADRISMLGIADSASMLDDTPRRLAGAIGMERKEQPETPVDVVFNGETVSADGYAVASKAATVMEKWDLGLAVAPSLTSEAVNIGAGLTVAYRISDKFSVGSGLSIAQLGVGENPNYEPGHDTRPNYHSPPPSDVFTGESAAVDYVREVSVTSSVVTLDIPLDLRYEIAKGFYTAVGVSYVAILNEQRTSHVVDRLNKNTFINGNASTAGSLASTEFVYSSNRISAQPLRGNGYAGFMNFSIGKKVPMSHKLFLSIEPYFKLPIGRLSKEEMNFTNGGIRIVTGF